MMKNGGVRDTVTVIAEGIQVVGDVVGDGDVEIHGNHRGAIRIGGELRIGSGGVAISDVVAARVRVDGRLEGRVRATQQVVIGLHGVLVGDVQGLLAIEDGGVFQGRVDPEGARPARGGPEPPAVARPEPRRQPRRLERAVTPGPVASSAGRVRTEPGTDREAIVTRKMPQVRDDAADDAGAAGRHGESRLGRARPAHVPVSTECGGQRPPSSAQPAPTPAPATAPVPEAVVAPAAAPPPAPPRSPALRAAAATAREPPRLPDQPALPPATTPPLPSPASPSPTRKARAQKRRARKAVAQKDSGRGARREAVDDSRPRLQPGDPVVDHEGLDDEWFEDEDFLLGNS